MIRYLLAIAFAALLVACGGDSTAPTPTILPPATEESMRSTPTTTPPATAEAVTSPVQTQEPPQQQQTGSQSSAGQIAFASSGWRSPEDGHEQITVVNDGGSSLVNLTNHAGNHHSPAWSPDGERIAFVSDRDGYLELYVMNVDGSAIQRITENDFTEEAPSWSPDGSRLVFACYPTREHSGQLDSQICTVNVDGSDFRNLSEGNVHGYDPVWSPASEQIAFVGMGEATFDQIYVVNADGSNLRKLTDNQNGSSLSPDWSPDGRRLVYASSTIQVVDVESGEVQEITSGPERYDNAPDWSPDGEQIAFIEEGATIMVMNADGSDLHEVADSGSSLGPSWSLDGGRIAFVSADVDPPALFIVSPDGSNLLNVIDAVSSGHSNWVPAWRPQADDLVMVPPAPTPESTGSAGDPPSVEEIYARAAESLKQPGMLYHQTVTVTLEAGLYSQEGTIERWVDVSRNVARSEMLLDFTQASEPARFDITEIIVGGMRYSVYREPEQRTDAGITLTCYGTNEAVAVVLGCPGFTEESTTTVEHGEYAGQPAIVLVKVGTSSGSDERSTTTERLYLDADTFLPVAREIEGTLDYGTTVPLHGREIYQHEFIPIDAVPVDFFDTVALAEEQFDALRPDFTTYWLGTYFDPGNGLPRLALNTAGPPDYPDATYEVILSYRLVDVQFAPSNTVQSEIVIQEWPLEAWQAEWGATMQNHWDAQECHEQLEIELPNGRAAIFMGYGDPVVPPNPAYAIATPPASTSNAECDELPYTRFEAVAYLGETVLFIFSLGESEYRSQEGFEAVLHGLQPRAPDENSATPSTP